MWKIVRINTRTKEISAEEIPKEYDRFGNRGLVDKIVSSEVNPQCDPLGPENKLVFCTGIFVGTNVPSAYRLSVGCKSPLTNGIKESNAGGTFARFMSDHGIRAMVFEDQPSDRSELNFIHIDNNGEIQILDASEYAGLNTYALSDKLHERFGKDISMACIGSAGERLGKIASVQATDYETGDPARSAARGGTGAVMGSKGLKVIVIEKAAVRCRQAAADEEAFKAALKSAVEALKNSPMAQGSHEGGTTGNAEMCIGTGATPVRNFSGKQFPPEKVANITREKWIKRANSYGGKQGCVCQAGCVIGCSNVYKDEKGNTVSSGIEYETFGLLCPNLDIADFDYLAKMDHFCDDIGIDSIDFGGGIGILMDMGELEFGDIQAVYDLTEEVYEGKTERAKLLINGGDAVGKAYGCGKISSVKNQFFAGYDPRAQKGTGVSYVTCPMGADHTAGLVVGPFDASKKEGACGMSVETQIHAATGDNMMCCFTFDFAFDEQIWANLYGAMFGIDNPTPDTIKALGKEAILMEMEFNKKAGMTDEDDRMPQFLYEEESYLGTAFDISPKELKETKKMLIEACKA